MGISSIFRFTIFITPLRTTLKSSCLRWKKVQRTCATVQAVVLYSLPVKVQHQARYMLASSAPAFSRLAAFVHTLLLLEFGYIDQKTLSIKLYSAVCYFGHRYVLSTYIVSADRYMSCASSRTRPFALQALWALALTFPIKVRAVSGTLHSLTAVNNRS